MVIKESTILKFHRMKGQKFGRWTVLKFIDRTCYRDVILLCRCDCGTESNLIYKNLKRGLSTSCGCRRKEVTIARSLKHGHNKRKKYTQEYSAWLNMRNRCYDRKNKAYHNYGGRGITVCNEWRSSFIVFLKDMGLKPKRNYSLDRINNNGNYEPGNCRWATAKEQNRNRRVSKRG